MFQIKLIKIWAYGSEKRFAWLDIDGYQVCVRIGHDLYKHLKANGVPTLQSLRSKQ